MMIHASMRYLQAPCIVPPSATMQDTVADGAAAVAMMGLLSDTPAQANSDVLYAW